MSDFIHADYQHLRMLLDDPTLPEDLSHINDIDKFAQNAFAEIIQKQTAELRSLQEKHPELSKEISNYLDKVDPQNIDELIDRNQYLNKINANIANEVVRTLLDLSQSQEKFNIRLFKIDLTDCGITRFPISEILKNEENLNVWMNVTFLDLSNNSELTNLDLRPFSKAKTIICLGNKSLKSINLSGLSALEDFQIMKTSSLLIIEMEGVSQKIKQSFELPISIMQKLRLIKKNFISTYLNWNPLSSVWSWCLSWFKKTQDNNEINQGQTCEVHNPCFEDESNTDGEIKSEEVVLAAALNDRPTTFLPSYSPPEPMQFTGHDNEIKNEYNDGLHPIYIKIPVKQRGC